LKARVNLQLSSDRDY